MAGFRNLIIEEAGPPPSSGDVVTRERLVYDRPEVTPVPQVRDALRTAASDTVRGQRETVVAALLARAEEINPTPVETIRTTVRQTTAEMVPGQTDTQMIALLAPESVPTIRDNIAATLIATPDGVPEPVELVVVMPKVMAFEVVRTQREAITAAIIEQDNVVPTINTAETVSASLTGYANANTNTGWTNPANAQGNTTGTAATLAAASSGLAGTTNNTTTGTLTLDFQDVNLGDLTISAVTVNVENQGATAGVAIAQPTSNVQFQYSVDGGTNWTNIVVLNTPATAKGIRTLNITGVIGQNQALLSALKIRATGSVTSGTGLGATNTVSFFRAWMTVAASRTY